MSSKQVGIAGEKIAENFLKNKGYKILDRNYIPKFISGPQRGEIDIVAKKDDVIVFMEVKAVASAEGDRAYPEDKVNFSKQRKIIKAAESWILEKKISFEQKWQIDVISIIINPETKKANLRHLKNAVF